MLKIKEHHRLIGKIIEDEKYIEANKLIERPWYFGLKGHIFLKYFRLAKNYPTKMLFEDLLEENISDGDKDTIRLAIDVYLLVISTLNRSMHGRRYHLIRKSNAVYVVQIGHDEPEFIAENGRSARWYVERNIGIILDSYHRILPISNYNIFSKQRTDFYTVVRVSFDSSSIIEARMDTAAEAQTYIDWAHAEEYNLLPSPN